MVAKKPSEVRYVIVHWVTIAHARIAIECLFLVHEGIRVLPYLVANSGMILKESLQSRVVVHKIFPV